MMRLFYKTKKLCPITTFMVVMFLRVNAANAQMAGYTNTFPLFSAIQGITTNSPAPTNKQPITVTNEVFPRVESFDMPISEMIANLARSADINYITDPRLTKWWQSSFDSDSDVTHEPKVTFRWKNLTGRQALLRLLDEHNLVMVDDAITSIARITYTNQFASPVDISLLCNDTNVVIPLIQLEVVPLDRALNAFTRQANLKIVFYGKLLGVRDNPGEMPVPQPIVSVRWTNITAKQAIVALCKNYGLIIVKDSATGMIQIKPKD
jgi:hypothetical protein